MRLFLILRSVSILVKLLRILPGVPSLPENVLDTVLRNADLDSPAVLGQLSNYSGVLLLTTRSRSEDSYSPYPAFRRSLSRLEVAIRLRSFTQTHHRAWRSSQDFSRSSWIDHERPEDHASANFRVGSRYIMGCRDEPCAWSYSGVLRA